jgi:OOP family OmpA-OmpF porin
MKLTRAWIITLSLIIGCILSPLAKGGDETTIKGFITRRTAESITVRSMDTNIESTILLTDDTKVQEPEGLFRHKEMSMSVLIPGLIVDVKGMLNEQGQLVARVVSFSARDLKTAHAFQSGLVTTGEAVEANKQGIVANRQAIATNRQGIEANRQAIGTAEDEIAANQAEVQKRFSNLSEYDAKANVVLNDFRVGKSELSESDKAALMQLAQDAKQLKGYLIQVKGFCDSTGSAAQNQELSRDRAEAVIAYLEQEAKVPMRYILAPGAMGTVDPVASNESAAGRAENRRVEVTVLLNRGVTGNQ